MNKDKCNIVHIISKEQGCTYKDAAEKFVMKMLKDRMDDMESAITDLISAAPADVQPGAQIYAGHCRNWVSGSDEWHSKSIRYKPVPTASV